MAIAYDSVSPDTTGTGSSITSGSWTIAGSNRVLIGFNGTVSGPTRDPTGMKWGGSGGTALTIIDSVLSYSSFGRLAAYQLIAPAASSTTLYGTCSGSADEIDIGGVSYTGVDQTSPIGTTASNTGTISGTSGTASVTIATAVGDTVVACLSMYDGNFQSPTSAPSGSPLPTERYEVNTAIDIMAIQDVVATGTSTTVSFAITSGAGSMDVNWCIKAVILTAAGGGGNTIAVPVASVTLDAKTPTVTATANNSIAVPLATITLAAKTPTVTATANQSVAVPKGSITLDAFAPVVTATANNIIAVPLSTISLNGFAPSVAVGGNQTVSVPLATISLNALTPTVTSTDAKNISVPLATITLAANTPTVTATANQLINVPSAAIALSGFAPTVALSSNNQISVPVASLTLAALAPTVSTGGPQDILVPLAMMAMDAYAPMVMVSGGGLGGYSPGGGGGGTGLGYSHGFKNERGERPKAHLDRILDEAEAAYRALHAAPAAVQEQAAKLVRPFTDSKKAAVPAAETVDWAALERDAKSTAKLLSLWRSEQTRLERIRADDEWFMLGD